MSDLPDFKKLRHDERHHLGLGDVRLTIAQQDAIDAEIKRLEAERDYYKTRYVRCADYKDELETEIERLQAHIAKLEKVLEHAKHLLAGGSDEAAHHLAVAIAAAEQTVESRVLASDQNG